MPLATRSSMAGAAVAGVLVVSMPALAAAAGSAGPPGQGSRRPIAETHPAWAIPTREVTRRPVTRGSVTARLYLAGRDRGGLAAFAAAVSTPGSPGYQHYLTPRQARARFGPTPARVTAVRSWLSSAGLAIIRVSAGGVAGGYVAARGPITAVSKAFGVSFGYYRGPGGHVYRAPIRAASAPAAVAPAVLAVTGLNTAPGLASPGLARPRPQAVVPPCSRYWGERIASAAPAAYGRHWPSVICGYSPRQLRSAYHVTGSGTSGTGQTLAIMDAYQSPTLLADASRFARATGDPGFGPGQYRQYQTGPFTRARECGRDSWYGEQTLDVEAVHGLALGAGVRYVAAGSCDNADLAEALAFIVNRHLASIVSNSWGYLEPVPHALYNTIFQAGAAEGIGFYFATGDRGYNAPGEMPGSSMPQVQFPPSSPWVTAVGGTSLAIGASWQYLWETSWGTLSDPLSADGRSWRYPPPGRYPGGYRQSGGGGVSTRFGQPFYQRGVVPDSLATRLPDGTISARPMRVIPDVAAVASFNTGMLVGWTRPGGPGFMISSVGGTSLACPVWAAIQADTQQATGRDFGFANPVLHLRHGTSAFHDVTDHPLGHAFPSIVVPGKRNASLYAIGINGRGRAALRAVRGYDDATGLGSPWLYIQSFRP